MRHRGVRSYARGVEARYLDHYSYLDSPIHRLGAHTKLAVVIGLVFLVLLIPIRWEWFHALVWGMLIVAGISSRLPLGGVIKRLRWIWLVVLMLSLGRLWQPDGVYRFLTTLIKSSECLVAMVLLANTTRFSRSAAGDCRLAGSARAGDDSLADVPLFVRALG